jgi:hypothetical protein
LEYVGPLCAILLKIITQGSFMMVNPLTLLKGLGLGAGMMYFFDPISGNRRRALVRDQINHACALGNRQAGVVYRDASNRLQGVKAEMGHLMEGEGDQPMMERLQEGATNMGRTLGMQGETWSPTAKAAALVGGLGLVACLMNKRDLLALAFGAGALTLMAKEVGDLEAMRMNAGRQSQSQGKSSESKGRKSEGFEDGSSQSKESNEGAGMGASAPTEQEPIHNL